jgi:hypothetical protein
MVSKYLSTITVSSLTSIRRAIKRQLSFSILLKETLGDCHNQMAHMPYGQPDNISSSPKPLTAMLKNSLVISFI